VHRQAIALQAPIDGRIFDRLGACRIERRIDLPAVRGNCARIEIHGLITKRHGSADRTTVAERRPLDGAERRRDQMVAPALRHAGLLRQQRGEILISDRRRHQRQEERTEPEGRRRGAHHPNTRRSHFPLPQRLQRNAHVVIETRRVWRECDGFIYCRVIVANALIARPRSGTATRFGHSHGK